MDDTHSMISMGISRHASHENRDMASVAVKIVEMKMSSFWVKVVLD